MYIKYQYSIINQQSTLKQRGIFLHSSLSLLSLSLRTLFDLIWKNFIPRGPTYCIRYRDNNDTLGQWGHVLLLNYHPIINTQQNPHKWFISYFKLIHLYKCKNRSITICYHSCTLYHEMNFIYNFTILVKK